MVSSALRKRAKKTVLLMHTVEQTLNKLTHNTHMGAAPTHGKSTQAISSGSHPLPHLHDKHCIGVCLQGLDSSSKCIRLHTQQRKGCNAQQSQKGNGCSQPSHAGLRAGCPKQERLGCELDLIFQPMIDYQHHAAPYFCKFTHSVAHRQSKQMVILLKFLTRPKLTRPNDPHPIHIVSSTHAR